MVDVNITTPDPVNTDIKILGEFAAKNIKTLVVINDRMVRKICIDNEVVFRKNGNIHAIGAAIFESVNVK